MIALILYNELDYIIRSRGQAQGDGATCEASKAHPDSQGSQKRDATNRCRIIRDRN
jgi:hypothetical protein